MKGEIQNFSDLDVWKKSHSLVLDIYHLTDSFPREERFCLVQQIRRASVSIPVNIAEGFKKRGVNDKINYYNIAQGSLEEVLYYLILSEDLGYLAENIDDIWITVDDIGRMLTKVVSSITRLKK